jgi:DNA invertase Pin-like site-specific DNA recombinase
MATAIYRRVSSKDQTTASQGIDLDAHKAGFLARGETVVEYADKFTGKTMNRPGWDKLWKDALVGKVDKIVVWRLDRLGRTVSGLSRLFEELQHRKIGLVSVKDGLDLNTAAGRLMAHVLASVAAYELEVKTERQSAGITAVRAALKNGSAVWTKGERAGQPRTSYGSGRKKGMDVSAVQQEEIKRLFAAGRMKKDIAEITGLSRPTINKVLKEVSA